MFRVIQLESIVGSEIDIERDNFYISSLWSFYEGNHTKFRIRYYVDIFILVQVRFNLTWNQF